MEMMRTAHLAFCAFEAEEKSLYFLILHNSNLSFLAWPHSLDTFSVWAL